MKSKGETVNMQSVIDGLMRQLEGKDHMIQHLLNRVDELESTIKDLSNNIEKMTGVISTYERRLFGTSSEKSHKGKKKDDDDNLTEGGENDSEVGEEKIEEEEAGEGKTRVRKSPTRIHTKEITATYQLKKL